MEKQEKIEKSKRRQFILSVGAMVSLVVVGILFSGGSNSSDSSHHSVARSVLSPPTEQELEKRVLKLDKEVRKIAQKCVAPKCFMETDPKAKKATKKLQDATRMLLVKRYGAAGPYRVLVDLEFQDTIPDYEDMGPSGSFVIEMAPASLLPHSVYMFLEIARHWTKGGFNRNAGHVLQVYTKHPPFEELAFQEYSPEFPHKEKTTGYAGRPSSSDWYVSIEDNTENHGPGSQQDENPHEADSCFGKIVHGYDDAIQRIKTMEGASGEDSFVDDKRYHVLIESMHIMVPGNGPGGYVIWRPSDEEDLSSSLL